MSAAHAGALGGHWKSFMHHLPVFADTLQWDKMAFSIITTTELAREQFSNSSPWIVDRMLADDVFNFLDTFNFATQFRDFLQKKRKIADATKLSAYYDSLLIQDPKDGVFRRREEKTRDLHMFISRLNKQEQYMLLYLFLRKNQYAFGMLSPDGNEFISSIAEIPQIKSSGRNYVHPSVENYVDTEYKLSKLKNGFRQWQLFHRYGEINNVNFMVPVIHWTKDIDGHRQILTDPMSEPTSSSFFRQVVSQTVMEKVGEHGVRMRANRINPLLGLILTAYFDSATLADPIKWPEFQSFHRGGKVQAMGQAQVGVLAIQQVEHFLGSPILSRLEELIANQK